MKYLGSNISRIDGKLKVTGAAKYAAEFEVNTPAYAFPVRSTIAKGTITAIDTGAATKAGGVIGILTHENAPRLKAANPLALMQAGSLIGESLIPLQENKIHYFGQYIALVLAETYEQARAAAALVKVTYARETPAVELVKELPKGYKPQMFFGGAAQYNAGKTASLIDAAPVKREELYTTSTENHHPMEPHATIAVWEGADKLTIYDATQGVKGVQGMAAYFFNLKPEQVQVTSPFVGGGFGCKGGQWSHILLTALAAQVIKRPVKFVLTRQMMVTNVGRRGATRQTVALASDRNGKLAAMRHHSETYTNLSDFFEPSGLQTKTLYAAPEREVTYKVARLNIGTPTFMRAPGETPGTFALESAIDELAYQLKIDPLQFRLLNHTATDIAEKLPFSAENLRECYTIGAEKFGWSRRKMEPRMNRQGNYLVGLGVATATYPAGRSSASARVEMTADGMVKVLSATQDIGTGTYTILAQTAADTLGVPIEKVTVEIGNSALPAAPVSGGSQTTATVNPAVLAAAEMLRKDLMNMATGDAQSKLNGRRVEDLAFADGNLFVAADKSKSESYAEIMRRSGKTKMEACATALPASGGGLGGNSAPCATAPFDRDENSDDKKYSFHSFGAQFAEVWVDEDLGTIRVARFLSVQDIGRVMNEKTARSQIIGGVIYGLGQALMEATEYDPRWGNPVTRHFGDYHIPAHLDVPAIEVHFIGKPDPHISPLGARGIGEIGTTGVAGAVANAVFNATGKRLRDLPLTPDKLL